MKTNAWLPCVVSVLTLAATPSAAHHSMSALFDFNQRFTRIGTVTRLEWINPHIYIHIEAPDEDGRMESWSFEGPSPVYFRRREGVDKADFQDAIGKPITVDASRARDGTRVGLIRMIKLPNGKVVPLCPDNC